MTNNLRPIHPNDAWVVDSSNKVVGVQTSRGNESQVFPIYATDPTTGAVTGLVGPDGGVVASTWLLPSGGDDTAALESWVNDCAARGVPALLGPGDFIVTGSMVWRSHKVISKWGGKGIGLDVRGCGAGNTKLFYSGPDASPMITVNSPTAEGIGNRNYLTNIEGMSWLRAANGTTEISSGSTSGSAFYGTPSAQYEVFHTPRFKDLFIDGFDNHITLDDCTLAEFDTVWFNEFLNAVRSGYNTDICKFRHCMFGSEQFGASFRNSATAFRGGYTSGIWTAGSENIVEFEHCWFMKIGIAAYFPNSQDVRGVRFNRAYFEDVRQYFVHDGVSNNWSAVSFEQCHFSKPTSNDTTQNDPTVAGYQARIQFGGDIAVTGGKQPILSIKNCTSDIVAPANAWVSFNNRTGTIVWENNVMAPSASFGHVRCIRSGYASWRSFPDRAGTYSGRYTLGDANQGGIGLVESQPIEVSATISAGATYDIDTLAGNVFYLTLPDGDCTINTFNYTGVAPNRLISALTRWKVVLIVPASVASTRTITWGGRLKMNAATLTYGTADANKRLSIVLEGYSNSGSTMQLASPAPVFV